MKQTDPPIPNCSQNSLLTEDEASNAGVVGTKILCIFKQPIGVRNPILHGIITAFSPPLSFLAL
jgi:hypothetical protein